MDKTIIHVDMDAFFAAIEIRDNSDLAGKPLIIGALPHERGVVSTCSYEARKYGVHSAMSIKEAYRRCPRGIYMHPNGEKYWTASQRVHSIWADYTDIVEYVSLDEGYLDVTGTTLLHGDPRQIGFEIKRRVVEEIGITCSVGVGYTMMSAKLASEEMKPDGFFEIRNSEALKKLIIDRDVRTIMGVGVKTAEVLHQAGLKTVRDLYQNRKLVTLLLQNHGKQILELADGIDHRAVTPYMEPKSIGKEHTFQEDIRDFSYLKDTLLLIAKDLSFEIHEKGLYAATVTLKITYANMKQITRSKTGDFINRGSEIYQIAASLLQTIDKHPVRLVGISLSSLSKTGARQISLLDMHNYEQEEKIDDVTFQLQQKFEKGAVKTANELSAEKRQKQ